MPPSDTAIADVLSRCREALGAVERFYERARRAALERFAPNGQAGAQTLNERQFHVHGFAWVATYAAALREMLAWADRLDAEGRLGRAEALMLQMVFGEYLGQVAGGLPISQSEIVRPADLDLDQAALSDLDHPSAAWLCRHGNSAEARAELAGLLASGNFGAAGLDETEAMIADQFRRLADRYAPDAHQWHLADRLIPIEVVQELADLGVFGLTIPEEWGGHGMGKMAMCIVTEELSRGFLGLGSLGTRSEIAAELIRLGGTDKQKARWLPRIASGATLPTAVFTEPDHGSDLGALRTRAERTEAGYRITGSKTWITHAARADLMTLLARTDQSEAGYRGLSMFLVPKPRGTDADPFPLEGMSGGEIPVLGYRGMKEYEIGFDGLAVGADALLGGVEGQGFKQLMATFESARIQTAARAVGVAQNALELGLGYALERKQFGRALISFSRVGGKLAWMAAETMVARQLTSFAAREKDRNRRCDVEAGMAKLLAARVAWANADSALQIHGGNGYALEYPISRLLCDARILNIFEGSAEIQAQVVARGLLDRGRN